MKRKLLVTLVATALELYAASAGAAGSCNVPGVENGAKPVRVGPLNPVDGFPEYVTDSNNVSVQRCLDPAFCFFDPIVPSDPFSIQIGSGGEAFYWGADAVLFNAAGDRFATVVMAAETAFLQNGANGEPIDESQFPFLRLRFTIGVPTDGTYTVIHPYGTDVFTVTGATGKRDVFSTVDRGMTPNSTLTGSVGPFLKWDPAFAAAPVGFLGDGGAAAGANPVVGSPCGSVDAPWNYVQLTGVDTAGRPVDFGNGEFALFTDLFNVQGKVFDSKVQTPLNPTRLTYSRSLAGAGQIDAFAVSTPSATVSVVDGPTIAAGTSRIATALTLDRTATSPTVAIDSASVAVTDASAVPAIVSMTAADTSTARAIDPLTGVVATANESTTLNLHLVDFVDIAAADFDPATSMLSVTATSGDQRAAPVLTLRDFGAFAAGTSTKLVATAAPPATVSVDSAKGGSATAMVRVITSAPPTAPTSLVSTAATSLTLTLSWTDTSSNENGFNIYRVAATGARTFVSSVGANVGTAVVSGLTDNTNYTFQVDAVNAVGFASSNLLNVSTLALPVAPSGVAAALSTTATRAINVTWVDNSVDETGFVISRATAATGPYTQVATAAAGATSVVDTSGPPATGVTYFYRVTAVRGPDSSVMAQSAAGLATPAAPTSITAPTFTGVTASSVTVNWTDRAANESGFDIYRSTTATGGFVKVGSVAANVTQYVDASVASNTQYFYRINSFNWAATVNGVVSVGVTPLGVVALAAVTNLAVTPVTGNPPALSWGDASSGESGYRVQRRTVTLSNAGVRTNGNFATVATAAANATGVTDAALPNNAIVEYSVAALNGATAGPVATVLAVPGGIPSVIAAPTITVARRNNVVTFDWFQAGTNAANRAGVGGYVLQRCQVTPADNCGAASAGWAAAATVTGRSTLTATQTIAPSVPARTYRFRVLSTTGANVATTVTGTPSAASVALTR